MMGKKGDSPLTIAILGGKKGPKSDGEKPDDDEGEDESMESASSEEVDAFKAFERAKGPEEKATALKLFIQTCGGY